VRHRLLLDKWIKKIIIKSLNQTETRLTKCYFSRNETKRNRIPKRNNFFSETKRSEMKKNYDFYIKNENYEKKLELLEP
jgi:hypothetical protein